MTTKRRYDILVAMRLSGRKPSSYARPWTQQQRLVLLTLIAINVGAFVAQLFLDAYQSDFVRDYFGLSGEGVQNAYAWQFLTAAFLHVGVWHLVVNILVLYFFGRDVESIIGQRHFLCLYLAGAAAGELGHLFVMPATSILLGASGGVAAVLMAHATILPELELTSFRFFGTRVPLKTKHIAYGAMVLGLVLIFADRDGTLTHSAYLGGCAAGWLYAHLLGFGRASFMERALQQRRVRTEHLHQMSAEEFIAEEVDPLLEKISREGMNSLSRSERRTLEIAREKLARDH
jgi:membrane associated rhomboid family serine protease